MAGGSIPAWHPCPAPLSFQGLVRIVQGCTTTAWGCCFLGWSESLCDNGEGTQEGAEPREGVGRCWELPASRASIPPTLAQGKAAFLRLLGGEPDHAPTSLMSSHPARALQHPKKGQHPNSHNTSWAVGSELSNSRS